MYLVEGFNHGVLNFVEFSAFASPEGGGIEENSVVTASASDFTSEKFIHIVNNPANGVFFQLIDLGIFFRPLNHAF